MNKTEFLLWEKSSRDTIDFKKIYVDITGDLIAGLLLSQIIFWNLPNKEGQSKLRVKIDGLYYLCKSREDWWQECRISAKQFDRVSKILVEKGLIDKKIKRFNGLATIHIHLNVDKLTELVSDELEKQKKAFELQGSDGIDQWGNTVLAKGKKRNLHKVKSEFDEKGNLKSTEGEKQDFPLDNTVFVQKENPITESTAKDNNIDNNKEYSKDKMGFSSLSTFESNKNDLEKYKRSIPKLPIECNQYMERVVINRFECDRDFYNMNFDEGINYTYLIDSIMATREKDNVEVLTLDQYNYLKNTLKNKLEQKQ